MERPRESSHRPKHLPLVRADDKYALCGLLRIQNEGQAGLEGLGGFLEDLEALLKACQRSGREGAGVNGVMVCWKRHHTLKYPDILKLNVYQELLHWHCLQASTMMVFTAAAFLAGEAVVAFARVGAASDLFGAGSDFGLGAEALLGAGGAFLGAGEALTTFLAMAAAVCLWK